VSLVDYLAEEVLTAIGEAPTLVARANVDWPYRSPSADRVERSGGPHQITLASSGVGRHPCIPQSLPDARAGRRHVEAFDSEWAQRVDDGVDDCRQCSDRAGFAGTLRAERKRTDSAPIRPADPVTTTTLILRLSTLSTPAPPRAPFDA
jgi:hypothetical protein